MMNNAKKWSPPISASVDEKPSVSSPILFGGPLYETVRRAAEIGYSSIDFHIAGESDIPLKSIDKVINPAGIKIVAVATGNIFERMVYRFLITAKRLYRRQRPQSGQ